MFCIYSSAAGICRLFRNVARSCERHLCKYRAEDFINKNCKKNNEANCIAYRCSRKYHVGCNDAHHTESNTRLREKCNTEVLYDIVIATRKFSGNPGAVILAHATENNVNYANENKDGLLEYGKVELCAAYNEE